VAACDGLHAIDSPDIEFIGEISDAEKPAFFSVAIALLAPIDWPVAGEDVNI